MGGPGLSRCVGRPSAQCRHTEPRGRSLPTQPQADAHPSPVEPRARAEKDLGSRFGGSASSSLPGPLSASSPHAWCENRVVFQRRALRSPGVAPLPLPPLAPQPPWRQMVHSPSPCQRG